VTALVPYLHQRSRGKEYLLIQLYNGIMRVWMESAERLMDRYGKHAIYFNFPVMSEKDAEVLLSRAETRWL